MAVSGDAVPPRPQLVRRAWLDLSGSWAFAYDDADEGLAGQWWRRPEAFDRMITVPYPPESRLSGLGDPGFHPVVWYRRRFRAPARQPDQRLVLHFGAVDYRARVWVDGEYVGQHEGGHTPFALDITDAGGGSEELAVVVRAEDQPEDLGQPRGKQHWQVEPHRIWYHRTTGIWQPVWCEVVGSTYVERLHWSADLAAGVVSLEHRLNRTPPHPLRLQVRLTCRGELLAEHTATVTDRQTTVDVTVPTLRRPEDRAHLLWSPDDPNLLDADLVVSTEDGQTVDEVTSYLGVRSVECRDGRFVLNGQTTYVRAVLEQGYWPESHLAAPDATALRQEVELVKELGFNTVRIHQKVEDPRFLYWCDRLGVMAWGEMANAYTFDAGSVDRLTREWLEVVDRDRSHPCVVVWVPLNESWGAEDLAADPAQRSFVASLYHLTKAVDPTRPVIGNDGWEHTETDIWGIHDYSKRGGRLRRRYGTDEAARDTLWHGSVSKHPITLPGATERGQPVMLTEFGGIRFDPTGERSGWGYSKVRTEEAFLKRLRELTRAVLASPTLAGFCYTQLTDTEQELNGLLSEDRKPKAPVERIRRIMTRPPRER